MRRGGLFVAPGDGRTDLDGDVGVVARVWLRSRADGEPAEGGTVVGGILRLNLYCRLLGQVGEGRGGRLLGAAGGGGRLRVVIRDLRRIRQSAQHVAEAVDVFQIVGLDVGGIGG